MANLLSREAKQEISPLLSEQVDSIYYIGIDMEVLKGNLEIL
ncbi:hypothetical protein [Radiobacillus sp. PE A8.2]